jgi:hypothetical protein
VGKEGKIGKVGIRVKRKTLHYTDGNQGKGGESREK